jgi:undecaprenyl pyrophosphate synthase
MPSLNPQLNNHEYEAKTIQELTEECFTVNKPVIDVSFFYTETKERHDKEEPEKMPACK